MNVLPASENTTKKYRICGMQLSNAFSANVRYMYEKAETPVDSLCVLVQCELFQRTPAKNGCDFISSIPE